VCVGEPIDPELFQSEIASSVAARSAIAQLRRPYAAANRSIDETGTLLRPWAPPLALSIWNTLGEPSDRAEQRSGLGFASGARVRRAAVT
jgi:hypothetical protein